jgi:hypothetical protein
MNTFRKDILIAVIIAICLVNSACAQQAPEFKAQGVGQADVSGIGIPDGNVISLGLASTLQYISQVIQGLPSTGILKDPVNDNYLLYWTMNSNVGFFGISGNGTAVDVLRKFCGSNCSNPFTFSDLFTFLKANGWQDATPQDLPTWLVTAFGSIQTLTTLYQNVLSFPMIMIAPGGNFANPYHTGNS